MRDVRLEPRRDLFGTGHGLDFNLHAVKWKERPEVTVERRGAEEDPDRAIISHGKNRSARIVYVRDGDV